MTPAELALITGELGPIIKAYVAQVTAPLLAHNKALELRVLELETRPPVVPERGERGEAGLNGKDGIDGKDGIAGLNGKDGAPGLDGKDGAPGLSGKDGATGIDGKDGAVGLNGKDGADGVNGKDGAPGLHGKDGTAGLDGKDGVAGLNGKDGAAGLNGKDGIGVMDAVLDREGRLVLTFSDGRTKDIGLIVGRDGLNGKDGMDGVGVNGAPGRDGRDVDMEHVKALVLSELSTWVRPKDGRDGIDGKDGLGFDETELVFDETRGYLFVLRSGDRVKEFPVPWVHDAGVWSAGIIYPKASAVTWDGHFWIAQGATTEQPGEGCKDWRLAVRRGKQGKEGKPGKDFTPRTTNTPPLYG